MYVVDNQCVLCSVSVSHKVASGHELANDELRNELHSSLLHLLNLHIYKYTGILG